MSIAMPASAEAARHDPYAALRHSDYRLFLTGRLAASIGVADDRRRDRMGALRAHQPRPRARLRRTGAGGADHPARAPGGARRRPLRSKARRDAFADAAHRRLALARGDFLHRRADPAHLSHALRHRRRTLLSSPGGRRPAPAARSSGEVRERGHLEQRRVADGERRRSRPGRAHHRVASSRRHRCTSSMQRSCWCSSSASRRFAGSRWRAHPGQ